MTLTDKYRADLLSLVEHYKAISDKADSSVSLGAFSGDHDFVTRLRRGQNFTVYKAERLEKHIDERINDIRNQLASGSHGGQISEEVQTSRKAASQPSTPHRSEESGAFPDEDRAEYSHRGFTSPHGV